MPVEIIEQNLLNFFASENPSWDNIEIKNFNLQSFEKTNILSDIYFFDLNFREKEHDQLIKLVLKLGLGSDKSTEQVWASEKEVMSKLFEHGYPVPKLFGYRETLIADRGAFIVMERIEGKMLSDLINDNQDNLSKIDDLLNRYVRLMIDLHNFSGKDNIMKIGRKNEMFTSGHPNPTATYLADYLKFTKHIKYDTLSIVLEWLIKESVKLDVPLELGITHGDYQTDNVIVLDNNELCIIDWGFARTADIRMDIHWSRLINGIVHNNEIAEYINDKYVQFQARKLSDTPFFTVASMVRLLTGLSQLAVRSKSYHDSVNKFLGNMDFDYVKTNISDVTGLDLPDLELDFRKVTGIINNL